MADFLTRLTGRTLGLVPTIRPRVPETFAPGSPMMTDYALYQVPESEAAPPAATDGVFAGEETAAASLDLEESPAVAAKPRGDPARRTAKSAMRSEGSLPNSSERDAALPAAPVSPAQTSAAEVPAASASSAQTSAAGPLPLIQTAPEPLSPSPPAWGRPNQPAFGPALPASPTIASAMPPSPVSADFSGASQTAIAQGLPVFDQAAAADSHIAHPSFLSLPFPQQKLPDGAIALPALQFPLRLASADTAQQISTQPAEISTAADIVIDRHSLSPVRRELPAAFQLSDIALTPPLHGQTEAELPLSLPLVSSNSPASDLPQRLVPFSQSAPEQATPLANLTRVSQPLPLSTNPSIAQPFSAQRQHTSISTFPELPAAVPALAHREPLSAAQPAQLPELPTVFPSAATLIRLPLLPVSTFSSGAVAQQFAEASVQEASAHSVIARFDLPAAQPAAVANRSAQLSLPAETLTATSLEQPLVPSSVVLPPPPVSLGWAETLPLARPLAASDAQRQRETAPAVEIKIGRIIVKGKPPASPKPKAPRQQRPQLSLSDYLTQRNGG
ncbi:MAG: hypothetical protein F6J97_17140 [Leptolyngbya sp. SIO4C1]|nr:hypothetical protein [Leptolyngbya sp. SIO4C1]